MSTFIVLQTIETTQKLTNCLKTVFCTSNQIQLQLKSLIKVVIVLEIINNNGQRQRRAELYTQHTTQAHQTKRSRVYRGNNVEFVESTTQLSLHYY